MATHRGNGSALRACHQMMMMMTVCLRQSRTDWRADGYRWRQNGTTAIPKQKPVIRKIHFDNIISTGSNKSFRKFVYSNADEEKPEYVVVQYVGDASTAANSAAVVVCIT